MLRPNRGAQVPEPTREDGEHVFDARRVVECEVARRLAGQLDAAQLRRAAPRRRRRGARHRGRGDHREAIRLSGEFHLELARMSGNPIFVRMLEELLPTTSLLMALYKAPGEPMCVAHSHRALLARCAGASGRRGGHRDAPPPERDRALAGRSRPRARRRPLRDVFKLIPRGA